MKCARRTRLVKLGRESTVSSVPSPSLTRKTKILQSKENSTFRIADLTLAILNPSYSISTCKEQAIGLGQTAENPSLLGTIQCFLKRKLSKEVLSEDDERVKLIKGAWDSSVTADQKLKASLKEMLKHNIFIDSNVKKVEIWQTAEDVGKRVLLMEPVVDLVDDLTDKDNIEDGSHNKCKSVSSLQNFDEDGRKKISVLLQKSKLDHSKRYYLQSINDLIFKLAFDSILENKHLNDEEEDSGDESEENKVKALSDTIFISVGESENELVNAQKSFFEPSSKIDIDIKKEKIAEILEDLKHLSGIHPITAKLLSTNKVYLKHPVIDTGSKVRTQLPAFRDPRNKMNMWAIMKENIGRDLAQVALPVFFNEPMSTLQKIIDFLEYDYLLRNANKHENQYLRLVHVFSILYILYASVPFRIKKPFNPLLGETFEYFEGDVRCVLEQVSHHPPISAFYCDCDDFTIWGHISVKANLSLSGFSLVPKGPFNVKLKRTDELFTFERPKYSMHNYMIGALYLWINGDMTCTNHKTGDKMVVTFKPKGWTSKGDYQAEGKVFDCKGKVVYNVSGMWNSHLNIIDPITKKETCIAKKYDDPQNLELQYYFSSFNINLNNLRPDMLSKLPPTDCRLRPDQRAYEYGSLELASNEKYRLEEIQRARRKENQKTKIVWKPKWFDFELNGNDVTVCNFKLQDGYFQARESGKWPEDLLDLYN